MTRERFTPEYTIVKDENMPAWSANVHVQWPKVVVEENLELLDAIEEFVEANELRKLEDGSYQKFSHGMARGKITRFLCKRITDEGSDSMESEIPMLMMDVGILKDLLEEMEQHRSSILTEDELLHRKKLQEQMDKYDADQIGVK